MNTEQHGPSDLTPLAWVQDEVRRTLEAVHKALRRQLREFELRQAGGQLDASLTASALQAQAAQLHQVAGVLKLVQLNEGQRLMLAAETLLRRCADEAALRLEQVEAVERAGFSLLTYATRLIAGSAPSPLALFPAYRKLQELNRAERIHPADFWPQHFEWRQLPPPQLEGDALPSLETLRSAFETALLRQMRESNTTNAAHLAELCAGLGVALGSEPQTSFWQLAAAHFEALAHGLLEADALVKRMASRLLAQLRAHAQGHAEVSDRLVQDLLFFCAQSGEPPAGQAPRLRAVRAAYGLDEAVSGDYRDDSLGRIDPAVVQQAQRRVGVAKEAWNACAEGDQARAAGLDEASSALTESLTQLFPAGELLGQTLQRAAVVILRSGNRPPAALAMEVATALLYVEAALEDGVYDNAEQKARVQRLAQRVQAAATGQPSDPLEAWMEDLFHRVAERQTLGSVMQELRVNLGEVERATDEYFRDTAKREALITVPGQLQAMRGVFSVLGLDQAAITCVRMRDEVDRLSNTEVDPSLPGPQAIFERLATNLGQLGFLIDMLSVQAPLAKSMFRFDEEKGELVASVERERRALPPKPSIETQVRAVVAAPTADSQTLARDLERLALQAAADDQPALAAATQSAARQLDAEMPASLPLPQLSDFDLPDLELTPQPPAALEAGDAKAGLQAFLDSQLPVEAPVAAPAPALPESDEELDEEMLEIFLEEANEVIANARAALDLLGENAADRAQLTNVRRAFHTLKGSSRMVGLNAYGEAGWACEQLYNARLADEKPADRALLAFSRDALDELAAWRDDIAAGSAAQRTPQALRERADALRLGVAAAPVPAPAPAPAPLEAVLELPDEVLTEAPLEAPVELALDAPIELASEPTPEPLTEEALPQALEGLSVEEIAGADSLPPQDFQLTEPMSVPGDSQLPLDSQPPLDVDVLRLDFDSTQPLESELPAADSGFDIDLSLPEPSAPIAAEALPDLDLQLDFALPEAAPAEAEPAELPEADALLSLDLPAEPELEPVVEPEIELSVPAPLIEPEPEPEPEAVALVTDAPLPDAIPVAEPEPEPVLETEEALEPGIQVGSLRIGEALHRIFSSEAEELSARLLAALQAWAEQGQGVPPASAEVHAHALAGNAATVGFASLSQLARALEHGLGRAQQAWRVGADDAARFVAGAEAIRALLQGFADGRLDEADAALIDALQAYEPEQRAEEEDSLMGGLTPALASVQALPDEDDFVTGQPDQIDAELWEIFEEEAGELLQQLHARLREWTSAPQDDSRGDACMRTLHTFKGGARLAGAMQLGELAHLLESDVLALLAQGGRSAAQLHPLQDRGDELEQRFEALRQQQRAPVEPLPAEAPSQPAEPQAEALPEPAAAEIEAPAMPRQLVELTPSQPQQPPRDPSEVRWERFSGIAARELTVADAAPLVSGQSLVRVRAALLDRLAAQSGEVSIRRARMENELSQMKTALSELDDNLERLRTQLRELEVQAEAQISSRQEAARASGSDFDPLEFDRYTRFQEVTRMLAESVNDVGTVQRSLQRNVQAGEDELVAQARLTRELQDDLLRSRMVEFESIGERLHRVVRQAARESGKQVQLQIQGAGLELDRGVLERLIGAFEHLLRNSVVHGIESPEARKAAGKPELGTIQIQLSQEGNQVLIAFRDDGAGLDLGRIRDKATRLGLLALDAKPSDNELVNLIYAPGFSTASSVTEMAGRGVGMDVVRAEVNTLGGYVLTRSQTGKGAEFDLRVPLTTALTQVVLLRVGELVVAVPASLIDTVLRLPNGALTQAYEGGRLQTGPWNVPIYWMGGLLAHSDHPQLHGKHAAVVLVHSGPDRIAIHVDEVIGNQEVVVKNLGPQLIHVPGLAGISLLASGAVALIYNPVALAERYGAGALARARAGGVPVIAPALESQQPQAPLILVVDDSLTVRRVSQRFLEREGLRVQLAKDGLDAMEQLAREELPDMVLSDIEMPRMDGFDLVRNIRADERLRHLPVVMITSRIAEKHREYAEALGVQGYLGKPYDEEQLLALIRQHTTALA